jgi:sialidase-1
MLKKILFLAFFTNILCLSLTDAQTVFTSGQDGFKSFRIPAIVKSPQGDLLAFSEGRVHGSGDFGDVDIVLKRSKDNGATWSPIQTVVNYATLQAGNPAPVYDLTDPRYPNGRLFLFYNTGNNHEYEVRKGNGLREAWYITSTDNGVTWSEPVNITTQVHRPRQPQLNPAYNFAEDWRAYANTPGHAMQFNEGPYKGRIYIAANHSSGEPNQLSEDYQAFGYYTDDHGDTFKISDRIGYKGSNEATAAPLSNGRLIFNSRNQKGDVRARIVAFSNDGGQTWENSYFDKTLIDPICQGSILTIGKRKGKNVLAFVNAADTKLRNNLTLRISFDEGKTWPVSQTIANDASREDFAAYSDLVLIDKKTVGILYELDHYQKIEFVKVNWQKIK